jgi:signal transduction histidine kinase
VAAKFMNKPDEQNRESLRIREARRLERIFIYHRWLYVVAIILMAAVYRNLPLVPIIALSAALAVANIIAWYYYRRLDSLEKQIRLSLGVLTVDGLVSWGLMLLFIREPSAIVYAIFALVVIEGAVRFSLAGSLLTGAFFIIGLSGAWIYRVSVLGMSFDVAAYVFWVGLVTLVSIMIGMSLREGRKQRSYAEALSTEKTLLLERRRISNELHDTVLKSLQGLALEAHALARNPEAHEVSAVESRALYIEEVCNDMSQEIRGVVLELRESEGNNHQALKPQMTEIIETWSRDSGIHADLAFAGEVPVLPLKLSHDLRRVVGEALANIQRHSGATGVRIEFVSADDSLKLEISDNGHGFSFAPDDLYSFVGKGKLGLVSMKERVELAGGAFHINSGDVGTTISVAMPLGKSRRQTTEPL